MKILIVKTSALGDIIHTFPVVSYLKRRDPTCQIDWVVEGKFAELVEAHPLVNRVLTIDSKKWRKKPFGWGHTIRKVRYDLVFDLQGNVKSSVVLAKVRAKKRVGLGWKSLPEWPNALFTSKKINPPPGKNIREDYLAVVQGYFQDETPFQSKPVTLSLAEDVSEVLSDATLVCAGAAWPNKQLATEQLAAVLKKLDRGPYLFAWGTVQEKGVATELAAHFPESVVLKRYSLPALQHIMAKSRLVVAMDSLPLHLAATTNTATLSFFGPSSAQKYGPPGEQHKAIQGECPYGVTFEKRCPQLRTCLSGACLKGMTPEELPGEGTHA